MASEIFRGEEDIDKSQIIITNHALEQFYKRSIANGLRRPTTFEENGLRSPITYEKIKSELRGWLNGSTHKNAIDSVSRVKVIINHGESYFFRCQRWRFVIQRDKLTPDKFVLVTVIYLDPREYNLCFKK